MSNEVIRTELKELENEKEKVKPYTNGDITVFWQADKCIHSANCIVGLPGDFIIRDADNQQIPIKREVTAICRCGASRKKPFCDGSHTRINFKD